MALVLDQQVARLQGLSELGCNPGHNRQPGNDGGNSLIRNMQAVAALRQPTCANASGTYFEWLCTRAEASGCCSTCRPGISARMPARHHSPLPPAQSALVCGLATTLSKQAALPGAICAERRRAR
eukprot:scaffold299_cov343-Prasinococcus_capsulatus_cf.AAC.6